ncbi:GNAT family N-acetyltransferase [Vibrio paucivorans]
MDDIHITQLSYHDAGELLRFEQQNRQWFETFIPSRGCEFYTSSGVIQHIEECLTLHDKDAMLPLVIKKGSGQIIGRANLHSVDIEEGSAHIGYRIDKQWTGQGIAKLAATHTLEQGERLYQLRRYIAIASVDNIASQKVLIGNGFKKKRIRPSYTRLAGSLIDCIEYWRDSNS